MTNEGRPMKRHARNGWTIGKDSDGRAVLFKDFRFRHPRWPNLVRSARWFVFNPERGGSRRKPFCVSCGRVEELIYFAGSMAAGIRMVEAANRAMRRARRPGRSAT